MKHAQFTSTMIEDREFAIRLASKLYSELTMRFPYDNESIPFVLMIAKFLANENIVTSVEYTDNRTKA